VNASRRRALAAIALAASTVGCDRLSKQVAIRELSGEPPRSYLGDTFRLDYVENRGAFLSLGASLPDRVRKPLLTGATGVLLLGIGVVLVRRRFASGLDNVGLSLVWAGGVSNLVDRIETGRVVDFMNVGLGPFRTGIFNVADVAIMLGIGLVLFGVHAPSQRGARAAEQSSPV
jgi:signal peptidase II